MNWDTSYPAKGVLCGRRTEMNWFLRELDLLFACAWGPLHPDEPGMFTCEQRDGLTYVVPRRKV